MMKFFLVAVFLSGLTAMPEDLLLEVRTNISQSFQDEEICNALYEKISKADISGDFLLTGYKGALEIAKARHFFNPFKKLSYFKSGRSILEEAIAQDTSNIELRFLRLTIQANVPGFLGYNEQLQADKAFITKNIGSVENDEFRNTITSFIAHAESQGKI